MITDATRRLFADHNFRLYTIASVVSWLSFFAQTLADFSEHASFPDPEPVRRYYEQRHAEAISAYASALNQIENFWRSAPEQPFPWEKTE